MSQTPSNSPKQPRPHVGPAFEDQSHRERFDAHELAMVLSHYDIGVIQHLRNFPRGSRRSPKVRIKSHRGEYLLKRRAPGQDDPYRVAFAHDLQIHLMQRRYPVAGIIGTRGDNNSMLQFNGRVYELFNYIHGTRYDRSPALARLVGSTLGLLHRHATDFVPQFDAPGGSFHGAPVEARMGAIVPAVRALEPQADAASLTRTSDYLTGAYKSAARRVDDLGFRGWARTILHGDWHPGNLLYREAAVAAVLDFDSVRAESRTADVANALLQFSMNMDKPEDPASWPEGFDPALIAAILQGYDESAVVPLSLAERQSLAWLMIEAMVIETVVPIAATGSFARIAGSTVLGMVERKIRWLERHAEALARVGQGG
jgi:homoserine kinase type II